MIRKPFGLPVSSAGVAALTALAGLTMAACGSAETVETGTPTPYCTPLFEDRSMPVPSAPDGASACATGSCNYQTQQGCPASAACRPQFNAEEVAVTPGCEAAGDHDAGDPCTTQGECGRGLYCAAGACRKMCCGGDWSACDPGESCIRSVEVRAGGEIIAAGLDLCFPVGTCDLFDPSSCSDEPGRECKIVDPTGAVACAPRSEADVGDPCGPPTVCKQGLNCVGGFCVKLCRHLECGEPSCGEGSDCVHFDRLPEGVGECSLGR